MRSSLLRLVLFSVAAVSCAPPPTPLEQSIVSCDTQVDNAVIARNSALTAKWGDGSSSALGNVVGFGFGKAQDNGRVNEAVSDFYNQNSVLYTPPAKLVDKGKTQTAIPIWQPPAIAIAVTYQKQLAFVRSYGYGNTGAGAYAEPDSLFRLASVSKTFTAMGILQLVHDGKLSLDYQPFADTDFVNKQIGGYWPTVGIYNTDPVTGCGPAVNDKLFVAPGGCGGPNPKLAEITVRDLLHHAGGWDRDLPGMADALEMAWPVQVDLYKSLPKASNPASCKNVIQYFLDQPLQHEPGTYSDYSNLGFCVLGEVIGYTAGKAYDYDYATYIQQNVFQPLGLVETAPGATQKWGLLDREVYYYDTDPNEGPVPSVFGGTANRAYGGWIYIEGAPGSDGWVSSVLDLARFQSGIATAMASPSGLPQFPANGTTPTDWPQEFLTLTEEEESYDSTYPQTFCVPGGSCKVIQVPASAWYGMGWDDIIPNTASDGTPDGTYYWDKGGGFPGTATFIQNYGDGWTVQIFMNAGPADECGQDPKCSIPYDLPTLANAVYWAVNNTSADYFQQYSAPTYTGWMLKSDFDAAMAAAAAQKPPQYPVRVDGSPFTRTIVCTAQQIADGSCQPTIIDWKYRARMGAAPPSGPLFYDIQRSCDQMVADLQSPSYGGLVSLQKFQDPSSLNWVYQAVLETP